MPDKQQGGWQSAATMLICFLLFTNVVTIMLLEITTRKMEDAIHRLDMAERKSCKYYNP